MKKFFEVLILSILSILAPIKGMALACLAIIILDLITGVIAAKKRKEPITSSGLKQTVIKLFVYEIALVVGFIIQQYMINSSIPITNFVSTLIGLTELKSVSENLEVILGQPFLASLISLISKKQNDLEP